MGHSCAGGAGLGCGAGHGRRARGRGEAGGRAGRPGHGREPGRGTQGFSGDGGPATGAELTQAFDVAVDSAGDLLFTDVDNGRIRMVNG